MSVNSCPVVDLLSKDIVQNPYKIYAELRNNFPLSRLPDGTYVLSRYEDVQFALKRHDLFSSGWVGSPISHPDWVREELHRGNFMSEEDPPEHSKHRAVVHKMFVEREIKSLIPTMEVVAKDLLDRYIDKDCSDFLGFFAYPYVAFILDKITGLDISPILDKVRYWVDTSESLPSSCPDINFKETLESVLIEQNKHFDSLIESRRHHPRKDLVTLLVEGDIDGRPLSGPELRGAMNIFMIGGFQAPAQIIAVSMSILSEQKALNRALRECPEKISCFIEEVMRLHSPAQGVVRVTKAEVEVSGGVIPRGEKVLALVGSANRDPSYFHDPDEINLCRDNIKRHMGLGYGAHACIGAALARLEIKCSLETILKNFDCIDAPRVDELRWVSTLVGRLLKKFPAKFSYI